jgi:hypothetical protein
LRPNESRETQRIFPFIGQDWLANVAVTAAKVRSILPRKQHLGAKIEGNVNEVFGALIVTISFRRWAAAIDTAFGQLPMAGSHYRYQAGKVLRQGRIVEIIRPVAVTLKEVLHDPPCRVEVSLRWRIDALTNGSTVRLQAEYSLNHAAVLRARHWDNRLSTHFRKQFAFLIKNLNRSRNALSSTTRLQKT